MNFTKQYTDLCKNDKVQGLRKIYTDERNIKWTVLEFGDYVQTPEGIEIIADGEASPDYRSYRNDECIWLPQEHDLDREIEKTLSKMSKNGEDLSYNLGVSFSDGQMSVWQITVEDRDYVHEEMDINPLIAKLKLLISILEEE